MSLRAVVCLISILSLASVLSSGARAGVLDQLSLSETPIGSDLPLDHFMGYKAKFSASDDPKGKFVKFAPVELTTQFGTAKFEVVKPNLLLLPADKNGEGVIDSDTHLKSYQIKRLSKLSDGSKQAKFGKLSDLHVANQCTSVPTFLQLIKEETLLLPTNKDPNGPADPVVGNEHDVDHFLCYKAKHQTKLSNKTKLQKFPKGTQVTVSDQFQTRLYDLKKITKLCAPTEKEEDPNDPIVLTAGTNKGDPRAIEPTWVRNPQAHLVCYQAKPAKKAIPQDGCGCDTVADPKCKGVTIDPKQAKHVSRSGFLNNQFGPESFEKTKEAEFCIPSVKNPEVILDAVVDLPSPAEPDETPGSPGVDPNAYPHLVTQFGGSDYDLNQTRYTRWRLGGPEQTPDAIVVLVAGFGGGANNFLTMAEDLIPRVRNDHGLLIEVWGFHRRTNLLEDREGSRIAIEEQDPNIALDWYYGDALGLTLHPSLVAGPNRRAQIYNTSDDIPFIANYTGQVHSRDINEVVDAARAIARNGNVFLGGHSAGTGFTARYASTDFNLTGIGDADPGYAKLRGLIMLEGGAGSTGETLSEDSLDRMEDRFDGGLFAAVRDAADRCVDGTPCTSDADCTGKGNGTCTPTTNAYAAVGGLSPLVTASSEPVALQGISDPDSGQVILQVGFGGDPNNNAVNKVPELALLGFLPPSTVEGIFGAFLDDDGLAATVLSPAIATSVGAPGPVVGGLATWLDISESASFPACPGAGCVTPDNGPAPTSLPASRWGLEKEVVSLSRFRPQFLAGGENAADWYFSASGLGVTSAPGTCDVGFCTAGDVGSACTNDSGCSQSVGLDSTQLSIGRGRRDIVNLTQAANIDIPVICFGGSNGLTPVPASYLAFAQSIGACTSASCDGTTRVIDPNNPNPAFPTFGNVDGGYEVHISEGFAHNDVTNAEDDADNNILPPLSDFIARNTQ